MSRWIDADALIAFLDEWKKSPNNDDSSVDLVNHFQGIIRTTPSIDIVRCKECKYWTSDGGALMGCGHTEFVTSGDDYCSYGERWE